MFTIHLSSRVVRLYPPPNLTAKQRVSGLYTRATILVVSQIVLVLLFLCQILLFAPHVVHGGVPFPVDSFERESERGEILSFSPLFLV